MQTLAYCWIFAALFGLADQNAQRPMPQGRTITARDGDTILLKGDERVRVVRRRQAIVILLADVAKPDGDPDGLVDISYTFRELTGTWPLGARWEGQVAIDEHSAAPGSGGPQSGIVLRTANGAIQLLSGTPQNMAVEEPMIAALTYRGSGWGISTALTFDQAEQRAVAELERNIAMNAERARRGLPSMTTFSSESPTGPATTGALVGPYVTMRQETVPPAAGGPVRVGSGLRSPKKIHDVPAVLPEGARRAGVHGMVVLELTVGADGTVTDARVLRSIPMLDKAAVDAARQWRYEPTIVNNQAVPIIVTGVVNFQ
jgi:TonB family protein